MRLTINDLERMANKMSNDMLNKPFVLFYGSPIQDNLKSIRMAYRLLKKQCPFKFKQVRL